MHAPFKYCSMRLAWLISSAFLIACTQTTPSSTSTPKATTPTVESPSTMHTATISNPTVKAAFDAWQAGDAKTWLSLFTANAQLFDDGKPRDFQQFSTQAIGKERFTSVDKVENQGTEITGNFHSPQWGNFKTYFKFHVNAAGKIQRLDIGQAH